jgi:Na+/melibiose symporter-like transporter
MIALVIARSYPINRTLHEQIREEIEDRLAGQRPMAVTT